MISKEGLQKMRELSLDGITEDELSEVQLFQVNCDKPVSERIEEYVDYMKNPYCFKCDGTPVKIRYQADDDLSDKLIAFFSSLKSR